MKLNKEQRKAIVILVSPIIALATVLTTYAVVSFIASLMQLDASIGIQIVRVALGFVGSISVMAMLVAFPLGLYKLAKASSANPADYKFKPLTKISYTVISLIVVNAILAIPFVVSPVDFISPITLIAMTATYALLIAYLIWIFKANRNLHAANKKLEYNPVSAVIWHFVPFANFIMPALVMKEIYGQSVVHNKLSALPIIWWTLNIAVSLIPVFTNTFNDVNTGTPILHVGKVIVNIILAYIIYQVMLGQKTMKQE